MTRQEFIDTVGPVAVQVRVEGGPLFPSVLMAQTLLETGGSVPDWNNIVGYKVGSGQQTDYWHGRSINTMTREVIDGVSLQTFAEWRAYDSVYDCLKDQALLFLNNAGRYQRVIDAPDPYTQADMLYACGYATDAPADVDGDPSYAEKLRSMIPIFAYLDEEAEKTVKAIEELKGQVEELKGQCQTLLNTAEAHIEEINALKAKASMPVPEWAQEAVSAAVAAGLIDTPDGGSYDFYRLLTILHRKGIV